MEKGQTETETETASSAAGWLARFYTEGTERQIHRQIEMD